MIRKISEHLGRLSKARRFGVPFTRRASFKLPSAIRVEGRFVPVVFPTEEGAKNDFLTCFIDDEYGLGEFGGPVRTIADIGANIGFFSMAARSYFPAATIHSYEPNPRVLPFCSKNAAAAGFTLFAEAVGAAAGYVSIEDSGDSNQAKTIPIADTGSRILQISLSTVVERLGGRIDLAKIDCEGAEWELFGDRHGWDGIKNVRMEYHLWGKHSFAEFERSLCGIGFEIHRHKPAGEWGTVWARRRM